MLLVPLRGDKIQVTGLADEQVVSSYSALKKGGAVYVKTPLDPKAPFIVLSMIEVINGVAVTQKSNSLLMPKGLIKRKLNLPQIGDTVEVLVNKDPQGVEEKASFEVTDLRLTNKPTRPLEVICGSSKFSLADLIDIGRKLGFEKFDLPAFRSLYLDYFPIGTKT